MGASIQILSFCSAKGMRATLAALQSPQGTDGSSRQFTGGKRIEKRSFRSALSVVEGHARSIARRRKEPSLNWKFCNEMKPESTTMFAL
jgi:hypothetical protein